MSFTSQEPVVSTTTERSVRVTVEERDEDKTLIRQWIISVASTDGGKPLINVGYLPPIREDQWKMILDATRTAWKLWHEKFGKEESP